MIRKLLLISLVAVGIYVLGLAGFFEMLIEILRLLIGLIEALDSLPEDLGPIREVLV